MKKSILRIIMAVFAFVAVLPLGASAAETEEGIQIKEIKGEGKASVKLTLPKAADEEIATLKLTLKVEGAGTGTLTPVFEFSKGLSADSERAKIQEYRYDKKTKLMNVYLSGSKPLFTGSALDIGKVWVQDKNKAKASFSVSVVQSKASYPLEVVRGSQVEQVALADYPSNPVVVKTSSNGGNALTPDAERDALREKLKKLVNQAKGVNKNDYTSEQYAELQKAIKAAEAVLKNGNATVKDVENVYQNLVNAMNNRKGDTGDTARDAQPTQVELERKAVQQAAKGENTGDQNPIWLYMGALFLSGAAVAAYVIVKKRRMVR